MSVSRRAGSPHCGHLHVEERRRLRERVAGAVRHEVLGQHHRELGVGHRHVAAARAVDDRDRRTPVALARDAPVAQPPLDLLVAETLGLEVGRDRVRGVLVVEPVVLAGVHADAVLLVGVPLFPGVGAVRLAGHRDHLLDRQAVLLREREIALVVRRDAHHGALAVPHQHVVADPDLDLLARERMRAVEPGRHPELFHRREVGLHHAAALARFNKFRELRVVAREPRRERVLGGDRVERHAHDRVGARREDAQQLPLAVDLVGEAEVHALAATDPVRLHQLHALGPAGKLARGRRAAPPRTA